MKLRITMLLFLTTFILVGADKINNHAGTKKVFICDSQGATKYHLKKNCKGLEKCEHKILKVTKEEAFKKGKTELCGFED